MGGLHPGDLVLIAGRPSMGKSSLARNLAFAIAWRGHKIHFASLEMSAGQLYARAASAMSYDTNARFAHRALRSQDGSYDRAQLAAFAARMPTTIRIDSRGGQTLPMLEASARETRRRLGGLDAIFVDYLQIMRALTSENRVQQITEISAGLKALAMNMGVPVVALSQLSRANESRDDKRPQLSDLRDSGSLEQDADVVMAVYREAYYVEREEPQEASYADEHAFMTAWTRWDERKRAAGNTLEVITLKQRHGEIGTDLFDFFPAYDVINEKERPRAALRVVR
jgi:replicative DNA helicase